MKPSRDYRNREFLLIHSRMLFFIEQYTYFSHIPLRPKPYILYRDDDGQIVKQPDFTEEPTDSSATAAGPHPCCGECKQTPRHLTKLSLSSSSLLSSHSQLRLGDFLLKQKKSCCSELYLAPCLITGASLLHFYCCAYSPNTLE